MNYLTFHGQNSCTLDELSVTRPSMNYLDADQKLDELFAYQFYYI